MDDLTLCKRIAEIENLDPKMFWVEKEKAFRLFTGEYWNPLTDWALLGPLMVKYHVEVVYDYKECSVFKDNGEPLLIAAATTHFNNDSQLPRAILECIIKAKG